MKKYFNYVNNRGEQLYTIHTPGQVSELKFRADYLYCLKEKEIKFDDKLISLICPINKAYYNNSDLIYQCKNNNIPVFNSAYDVEKWVNVDKLKYIYNSLITINTPFCLIMDGADTWLCADEYGEELIDRFSKFNAPIVYNGDFFQFPTVDIEGDKYRQKYPQINRYLNAGVCFGKTGELISFYKKCIELIPNFAYNQDEQMIIRTMLMQYNQDKTIEIDRNNDLFLLYHKQANVLEQTERDTFTLIK